MLLCGFKIIFPVLQRIKLKFNTNILKILLKEQKGFEQIIFSSNDYKNQVR